MENRIAKLEREVRSLEAAMHAQTVLFIALIRSHPNYNQLQLDITSCLEVYLSGPPASKLAEKQQTQIRDYVEDLQSLRPSN